MAGGPEDQQGPVPGLRGGPYAGRHLAEAGQQQLVHAGPVPSLRRDRQRGRKGVFQRYKLARRDGLHWSFARCVQMPTAEHLARWEKMRTQQIERMQARAEKQAAEKAEN